MCHYIIIKLRIYRRFKIALFMNTRIQVAPILNIILNPIKMITMVIKTMCYLIVQDIKLMIRDIKLEAWKVVPVIRWAIVEHPIGFFLKVS